MRRLDVQSLRVVVPAHDEESHLAACLASLRPAVATTRQLGIDTRVVVVADACTDATAAVAAAAGADVFLVDARCVGVARDTGVRHALAAQPTSRTWVSVTDADSTVGPDWLHAQVRAALAGADLWVGDVSPAPGSLPPRLLAEWHARHAGPELRDRPAPRHVYGANLGFTAATYLAAGGFPPVAEHEDVAFVRAALDAGARWTPGTSPVLTSGRTQGRTPGGFAGYLHALETGLEIA